MWPAGAPPGELSLTVQRHGPAPEKKQRLQAWLPGRLAAAADATLAEHAAAFATEQGLVVSLAIVNLPPDDPARP